MLLSSEAKMAAGLAGNGIAKLLQGLSQVASREVAGKLILR